MGVYLLQFFVDVHTSVCVATCWHIECSPLVFLWLIALGYRQVANEIQIYVWRHAHTVSRHRVAPVKGHIHLSREAIAAVVGRHKRQLSASLAAFFNGVGDIELVESCGQCTIQRTCEVVEHHLYIIVVDVYRDKHLAQAGVDALLSQHFVDALHTLCRGQCSELAWTLAVRLLHHYLAHRHRLYRHTVEGCLINVFLKEIKLAPQPFVLKIRVEVVQG